MKHFKFLSIFFLVLIGEQLFAQKTKFTSDTAFVRELNAYFPVPEKNEINQTLSQFTNLWNSGQLNLNQKEQIISVSNQLLKKRAKPIPQFENYLKIILFVQNSNQQKSQMASWLRFLEDFTAKADFNSNSMSRVFENVLALADSSVLFQSAAVKWKHNTTDYKLNFESGQEAHFYFNKTDLICFSKRDSSIISGTSGYYFPVTDRWVGKGGTVTWERSGLSKDSVFVKLNNYRINLKLPEYKADTVEFTNKKYFQGKLEGRFEEKILANAIGEKASYPKFESYNKRVDLHKVVPNIDFSGGFSMSGSKFLGTGDSIVDAQLFIYRKNDLFAKASANTFVFDKENVIANNTQVQIYLENDSIWHPGLYFNYLIKENKLALNRAGTGSYRSKFYDTYHKLDVDVSEISLNLNDTLLLFKSPPASTYRKAIFESSNYFSENSYREIGMMDFKHPLEAIREMAPTPGEEFTVYHLASYLSKAESYCVNMLNRLSDYGFVKFDLDKRVAYTLPKLYDYVRSKFGKKDYDAIRIISEPSTGNNATIGLKDNILTIYGVKPFALSDNRRVGIYPKDNIVTIKKDLEIDFDGRLQAGLADLYGKDMTFNYDSFYIRLQSVDSLALYYQSEKKNKDSVYEYSSVRSTVDSITGLLRIDNPENKSGVKTIANYPIFESHQKSYVFYDQKSTNDTIYKKKDFYFENFPFEIDSLNTITKNNISIAGTLRSGGVFPDIEEVLLVQPDSSLGFVHDLNDTALTVYNGLGTYNNAISLSNSGLKGNGKITYLNTGIYSEQFDFYPDSMNTYADKVEMLKQDSSSVRYPQAFSDSAYVHWEPARDQMFISSLTAPINVFEDKANFKGTLRLKPKDLTGKGVLTFIDANLKSNTYTFFDESFKADTADFKLQPNQSEESPFLTYNVNADVNFDNKLGMFKSNGKNSYIDFPVNQFKCYMNYFSWRMGINQIDIGYLQNLEKDTTNNVAVIDSAVVAKTDELENYEAELNDTSYTAEELAANSRFISTHPNQDSLSFYAKSSSYDIANFIIKAKGVKFINVADAHIFPSSPVFIEPNANLRELSTARIVTNRQTRFHKFFDANVKIKGAKNYSGSGDYEYIDRLDSLQIIHFEDISVDKEAKTFANGTISNKIDFRLGPEFSYYGKMKILAEHQFIDFEGYTRIAHECDKRLESFWLHFSSEINPDSIVIPLEPVMKDNDMRKLKAGLFSTYDSVGVYTNFINPVSRFTDIPVLEAGGFLTYNTRTGYYEITDSTKLKTPEKEGNYISLHKKLCLVLAEGKMDFGTKFGQVKLSPTGAIRQNLDSWTTIMDIMLPVDFYFNEAALTNMGNRINENYSLDPVDPAKKEYKNAFTELVGLERLNQLTKDFSLLGAFESVPPEMKHTLFFSKVQMKWDNEHTSWKSVGKIGIGNLNGLQINKMVNGYIEVKRAKIGDILNIYLEVNPKIWYFFTYTRGTMKTISSEDDYNKVVINLKDRDRKSPVKDDDNPYMFYPATDKAKENFVAEMKKEEIIVMDDKDINLDDNSNPDNNSNSKEQSETESDEEDFNVIDNNNKNNEELELEEVEPNNNNVLENNQTSGEVQQDENKVPDNDNKNNEVKKEENNENKQVIDPTNNELKENPKEENKQIEENQKKKEEEIKENPPKKEEIKEEEEENIPLEGGEEEEEEG